MWPTQSTELTLARLVAWLSDSERAAVGAGALRRCGYRPSAVAETLHFVTEAPASTSHLVILIETAKREAGLPAASAAIERWLLVYAAAAMLSAARMPLGNTVLNRTCAEIASLLDDAWATEETLLVTGIRFREFAKMATGRRFSAGLFHWDICGVSRSWLLKVPPRDVPRPGARTGEAARPRTGDVSTLESASPAGPSRGAGDQRCARRDG